MRWFASCWVLVAGCGRIGFDDTGPGTTGSAAAAVTLAAGAGTSCAVRGGAVWCWGRSDARQLGIDSVAPQPTPVQAVIPARAVSVAANEVGACAIEDQGGVWCWGNGLLPAKIAGLPHPATKLALGGGHACALLDDASVWCWGDNGSGQDGVDPATTSVVDTPVPALASATDVAAGIDFTCAVKTDASVWCWGANDLGSLGDGTSTSRFTPAAVPGVTATSIAAGGEHACALAGGAFRCWGNNSEGELGANRPDGQLFSPAPASTDMGFVTLAAGDYTTCAIDDHGAAFCWGNGNNGEQGDGQRYDHGSPVALGVTDVIAIAQGDAHGCLEHTDGTVACWGYGSHGELGDGRIAALVPRKVPLPGASNFVAAGHDHACAMVGTGMYCWGSNAAGELGVADASNPQGSSLVPILVPIGAANGVWAGDAHTCALVGGNVVCWGRNDQGQDGSLPLEYTHPPTMVAGLPANNGASCAGEGFSCTYNINGMYCWGVDDFGQLGDGGGSGSVTPVLVGQGTQPACGEAFGCSLIAGGLGCWGYNSAGQLGIGSQDLTLHPLTPIANTASDSKVVAGADHACALSTALTVDCWGANDNGQLGDGTTSMELSPITVPGISNVSQLAAGGDTTCVAAPGSAPIECWGLNDVGQVGDGTATTRLSPVATPLTGFSVAVGNRFACAVTSAQEVWCWGDNADGQIGSGPQTRSLVPVNVAFP